MAFDLFFELPNAGLQGDDQRPAFPFMCTGIKRNKVLWPVVVSNPVDVVNVLGPCEFPFQEILHHEAVLEHVAPADAKLDVARVPGESAASPIRIAGTHGAAVVRSRTAVDTCAFQPVHNGFRGQPNLPSDDGGGESRAIKRDDVIGRDGALVSRRDALIARSQRHGRFQQAIADRARVYADSAADGFQAVTGGVTGDQIIGGNSWFRYGAHQTV